MEQMILESPLGLLTLYAEGNHLVSLVFGNHGGTDHTPLLLEAKQQLAAYFSGKRQEFSLPLAPNGTVFQKRVWAELCKIPYGTTISYRMLAERVGASRGFQAVGQANKRNPLPIFIPCHRVIAADGSLGGYSGGLEKKSHLLNLEQQQKKASPV